jgi:purine-nucleoside phosphorylase
MTPYEKLMTCANTLRGKTGFKPDIALVLGSGLGDFAEGMKIEAQVPYAELEGFPVSTVPGHRGRFVFGYVGSVPVVAMQGRVHYYEGYDIQDVVLPIRLMGIMGARALFLTNAAGGVSFDFSPGDLMLITDQIAGFIPSPLRGPNIDELGTRFPDMSAVYDPAFKDAIREAAKRGDVPLREGVYLQTAGPQFESPAEIRAYRALGADAVGMSTACEAIAARHMGLRVCGVSCISNLASGMSGQALTHEEVQATADIAAPRFKRLITGSIEAIGKLL